MNSLYNRRKKLELKSKIKKALLILFVLMLIAVVVFGSKLVAIGTSYKAKMLCSEVFVAGREKENVLKDLAIDDLKPLENVTAHVNYSEKSVSASFYGMHKYKVTYQAQTGCSLESGNTLELAPKIHDQIPQRVVQHGLDENLNYKNVRDIVNDAFLESNEEEQRRTRAVVILKSGQVIAEQYGGDTHVNTPLLGWSVTKSVMNALVGILIEREHLSLQTKVFVDGKRDGRENITVENLLNMTSGLGFNEEMTDPLADVIRMVLQETDMAAFAASKDMDSPPGTKWYYSSGNTILLSEYIRRILGPDEYQTFPRTELFDRIGMTGALLETDSSGTYVGSSYMYATARDWAKLGQLYLQDGVWNGEQLLPKGWVEYSLTPAPGSKDEQYGAHFWLDIPEPYASENNITLPRGTFHAIGHESQFITIVPSHELVVVRLGKTRYPQAWKHDLFVGAIIDSLQE